MIMKNVINFDVAVHEIPLDQRMLFYLHEDIYKDIKTNAETNQENVDYIIQETGILLNEALRDMDIATSNTEKFYLLLPNTDAAGAVFFIGRVLNIRLATNHLSPTKSIF